MHLNDKNTWTGELPGDLRLVLHRLAKKDVDAYVVGPAVRDALLNGNMDKVQRMDIVASSPHYGTVERCLDGVATEHLFLSRPERFRRSTAFTVQESSGGKPIRRYVITEIPNDGPLEEELSKREVTVNAMALNRDGVLFDPYDGLRDLVKQQIRPIMSPAIAFVQKPLNLLKVAKHVAYHGYDVEPETEEFALKHSVNVLDIPPERIRPELERLLVNLYPDRGLDFLQRVKVLQYLLPEVQALVGFNETCRVHHKDIWDHTKKVVSKAKPVAPIRWAALFHDVGKVGTRSVEDDGTVHFFRHEDMSGYLFRGIAARLALDDRIAERIYFLVVNHSRVNMYSDEWTDSAVRRLIRETGEYLGDLLAVSRADITSRQERKVEELTRLLDELAVRIEAIKQEDAKQPLVPKGAGQIIMEHFSIPPSPLVGQLRDVLENALEEKRLAPDLPVEEYMPFLEDYIKSKGKQ